MRLSLVVALFLAASLGADAAPQAKVNENDEPTKIVEMVTVSGTCTRLVHAGLAIDGCKPILVNMNYSTGVSAYWFMTAGTILSFSGDGARRVEQGPDIVVQAIATVILAATADAFKDKNAEAAAIGFCRFGDPTIKGSTIECVAHTPAGLYEGAFTTDGNPPQLETFQIEP
jgi:hypothetical protein